MILFYTVSIRQCSSPHSSINQRKLGSY